MSLSVIMITRVAVSLVDTFQTVPAAYATLINVPDGSEVIRQPGSAPITRVYKVEVESQARGSRTRDEYGGIVNVGHILVVAGCLEVPV